MSEKVESLIQSVGLSHLVGRTLGQRGGGISGGERQRIALARCLAYCRIIRRAEPSFW
ncbi:MAG: ATP-binding cassette domain-containing protein [bacterium]